MQSTHHINELLSPITLRSPVRFGSLRLWFNPSGHEFFSDIDLHGHTIGPGGVDSKPYIDHASGVLHDYRNHYIRIACAECGLTEFTVDWDPGYKGDERAIDYCWNMMELTDNVQPYLCWLLNLLPHKTIELHRQYDYSGSIELPHGTIIRGRNHGAGLRVKDRSAMERHKTGWEKTKEYRLASYTTGIFPHNQCEEFTLDGVELDGNWEGNTPWIEDPTGWDVSAIQSELQNTPAWGGICRTNHGGRVITKTQRATLNDVYVHGYGSACLLGGNNWRGVNVRVGDCLGNHQMYWANGDWSNLELSGFAAGEYARLSEARIGNLTMRNGSENPMWEAPTVLISHTGGDRVSWGKSLQREHQGVSISRFHIDLRGTRIGHVFGGGSHAFRLGEGVVRTQDRPPWPRTPEEMQADPPIHVSLFSEWGNVGPNSDVYQGQSIENVTIIHSHDQPNIVVELNNGPNVISPRFSNIQTVAAPTDYTPRMPGGAPSLIAYNNFKGGAFWHEPAQINYRGIRDHSQNGFVLKVDIDLQAKRRLDVVLEDCHFHNSSTGVVVSKSHQGTSALLPGNHDLLRIFWRHCSFIIWDNYQGNLELLWELSKFKHCRAYFGTLSTNTVNWDCWVDIDGIVSSTPSPCN